MSVASLGMYDFPWLRNETDRLWAHLRAHLGPDAPETLDRPRDLRAIWRDPDLLLAQTCGYPLMTELQGVVRVVATPVYDLPGCDGGKHCSFVVVRETSKARTLADARGWRVAINGFDSNSGMNLLRAAVAPLAHVGRFFGSVTVTGAHLESLAAVRDGRADIAAIDCVTHGLAVLHQPDLVRGTRVLDHTRATPALPFVTSGAATDAQVAALRAALDAVLPWQPLRLAGVTGPLDYAPVMALEREAAANNYPTLA